MDQRHRSPDTPPETRPQLQSLLDPQALRGALAQFATGVTLITTHSDRGPVGITVNSFASVSLDPPLVLWSIARASRRCPAFRDASRYAIHVLAKTQEDLCRAFTKDAFAFDQAPVSFGPDHTPLIDGSLARFECTPHAVHDGGDHLILVGRVQGATVSAGAPLIFFNRTFQAVDLA